MHSQTATPEAHTAIRGQTDSVVKSHVSRGPPNKSCVARSDEPQVAGQQTATSQLANRHTSYVDNAVCVNSAFLQMQLFPAAVPALLHSYQKKPARCLTRPTARFDTRESSSAGRRSGPGFQGQEFYATCHPGLEEVVASELSSRNIQAHSVEPSKAGVYFRFANSESASLNILLL